MVFGLTTPSWLNLWSTRKNDLATFSLYCSVQFSHSVVSNSLWLHESQHARPPCPSTTPGVHSDSHSSSQWCHPAISSSVVPFSTCPQSRPYQSLFQWVNSLHEVAKVLELQLNIIPSKEHPELISFRMDWLDLLAVLLYHLYLRWSYSVGRPP